MIHALYDHMEWADALVWRAAVAAPEDRVIKEKLHHIHMVQHAYLDIWHGRTPQPVGLSGFATLNDLLRWAREAHRELMTFIATIDESSKTLDEPLNVPWAKQMAERAGQPLSSITLRETLMQIPQHSTYHRGQVNMRLREIGAEPPLTDFIAWAWFGKQRPQWP